MTGWKKVVGTGLLLSAAVVLAACGGNEDTSSSTDQTDFTGDSLTIGVWGGNEAEGLWWCPLFRRPVKNRTTFTKGLGST